MTMIISGDGSITGLVAGGLPDATVTDADLSLTANSAPIKTALNASGDAPIYACRAWVNFNGTGTVAIRASGNVSSITDNGTGDYTINFTTAMPDANYCFTGNGEVVLGSRTVILQPVNGTYAVGSVRVLCINNATDTVTDTTSTNAAIFR